MNNNGTNDILRNLIQDIVRACIKEILESYVKGNINNLIEDIIKESAQDILLQPQQCNENQVTSKNNSLENNIINNFNEEIIESKESSADFYETRFNKKISIENIDFSKYKLNNNLKNILTKNKILQLDLANAIEVSRGTIMSIMNSKGISLENAFKISKVFNMSIYDIFTYTENMELNGNIKND